MSAEKAQARTALMQQTSPDMSVTFAQMERMAQSMAKSNLFGVKTPDQALSLMLISQAEGRSPALAALDYHIIQNRPSLKADTILARFQQAGGTVKWLCYTDQKVEATFSHPSSSPITVDWTIERASKVKQWNREANKWEALTDKLNWQNYPRNMLRARVVSEGVRASYPGVAVGIYTPEEIQDGAAEIDVTPVSQDEAVRRTAEAHAHTALTEGERTDHLNAIKAASAGEELATAFAAAWKHASEAKDATAREAFKAAYEARKQQLAALVEATP